MKILTVCYLCVLAILLTGCFGIQDLQVRIAQAEVDLNANQKVLDEARQDFNDIQDTINEKSANLDSAIQSGNMEEARLIKQEIDKARIESARVNDRITQAEKDNDEVKNIISAVKSQAKDATGPIDYLLAIGAVAGAFFGVPAIAYGAKERQRRKVAEANQLNSRTN